MNGEDERQDGERSYRRQILDEIEAEVGIDRCVGHVRRRPYVKCIAVCRRASDELRRDAAAGPRPAFDHYLLTQSVAHNCPDQPSRNVRCRAGREADDQPKRLRWKIACAALRHGDGSAQHKTQAQNYNSSSSPCLTLLISAGLPNITA